MLIYVTTIIFVYKMLQASLSDQSIKEKNIAKLGFIKIKNG